MYGETPISSPAISFMIYKVLLAAEAHFGIRVVTYAAGSQKCTYTERMLEKKLDFNVLLGKQKYELS